MHNNKTALQEYIKKLEERAEKFKLWIETGKTPIARVSIVKKSIGAAKIRTLIAKYTNNNSLIEIQNEYLALLREFDHYWPEGQVLLKHNGEALRQYLDYDDMLWMLSLGVLLGVPNQDFKILERLIHRDKVQDRVFEFLLNSKISDRIITTEESYEFGWELYSDLRKALNQKDFELTNHFVTRHLDNGWEKSHKDQLKLEKGLNGRHFGNWSFESAAIVVLMGLDDSNYRNKNYYPWRLANFYRNK